MQRMRSTSMRKPCNFSASVVQQVEPSRAIESATNGNCLGDHPFPQPFLSPKKKKKTRKPPHHPPKNKKTRLGPFGDCSSWGSPDTWATPSFTEEKWPFKRTMGTETIRPMKRGMKQWKKALPSSEIRRHPFNIVVKDCPSD